MFSKNTGQKIRILKSECKCWKRNTNIFLKNTPKNIFSVVLDKKSVKKYFSEREKIAKKNQIIFSPLFFMDKNISMIIFVFYIYIFFLESFKRNISIWT